MKIIVCVDERGGLSFAKKRHATDRLLREDMPVFRGLHHESLEEVNYPLKLCR